MPHPRRSVLSCLPQSPDLELVVYVDGSSVPNPGPSGFGLLLLARTSGSDSVVGIVRNVGFGGNNTAEFLGLVEAAAIVRSAKPRTAMILSDSLVGLRLVTGSGRVRAMEHQLIQRQVSGWFAQNRQVQLCWVERRRNLAHHLARFAATLPDGEQQITALGVRDRSLLKKAS